MIFKPIAHDVRNANNLLLQYIFKKELKYANENGQQRAVGIYWRAGLCETVVALETITPYTCIRITAQHSVRGRRKSDASDEVEVSWKLR